MTAKELLDEYAEIYAGFGNNRNIDLEHRKIRMQEIEKELEASIRKEVVEEIKSKLPTLRRGEYYETSWLQGFNYYLERTRDILKGITLK